MIWVIPYEYRIYAISSIAVRFFMGGKKMHADGQNCYSFYVMMNKRST